jgi:hypothetical protein
MPLHSKYVLSPAKPQWDSFVCVLAHIWRRIFGGWSRCPRLSPGLSAYQTDPDPGPCPGLCPLSPALAPSTLAAQPALQGGCQRRGESAPVRSPARPGLRRGAGTIPASRRHGAAAGGAACAQRAGGAKKTGAGPARVADIFRICVASQGGVSFSGFITRSKTTQGEEACR